MREAEHEPGPNAGAATSNVNLQCMIRMDKGIGTKESSAQPSHSLVPIPLSNSALREGERTLCTV